MSTNPPVEPVVSTEPPREPVSAAAHREVAPAWHTALFVVIVIAFAMLGAREHGQAVSRYGRESTYVLTIAWEWLLVGYIVWGTRKRNLRLRDLIGGKWKSPEDFLLDIAVAVGFWVVAAAALAALTFALGLAHPAQIEDAKRTLGPLMPQNTLERITWVALSCTAGFCEEVMFRGYLQAQVRAWTGNGFAAAVAQAIVFGIAHAYQGGRRIVLIGIYGLLFGILVLLRKSLRPGMVAHAMQDTLSGLAFRLLK